MTASSCDSAVTQMVLPTARSSRSAWSRCSALTLSQANKPVMPAPSSAGVLGMQRTMGCDREVHACRLAKGTPAAIETIS